MQEWLSRWNDIAEGALPDWYTSNSMSPVYEYISRQGFPTVSQLRRGILLGCISHAMWLAANEGMFEYEKEWIDTTYCDDNGQGERWAVDFSDGGAVAVFYTNESDRNPYPEDSPPYDQDRYFRGMPVHLQAAKERALWFMPDLNWEVGTTNGVITAAMWAVGDQFTAAEDWPEVFRESAHACYEQLLPYEVALVEWEDDGLFDEQMAVVQSLYTRKLSSPDAPIVAEEWEREAILGFAGTSSPQDTGIVAATRMLAEVGIILFP